MHHAVGDHDATLIRMVHSQQLSEWLPGLMHSQSQGSMVKAISAVQCNVFHTSLHDGALHGFGQRYKGRNMFGCKQNTDGLPSSMPAGSKKPGNASRAFDKEEIVRATQVGIANISVGGQ